MNSSRLSPLFQGPSMSGAYAIRCLVPDLPTLPDLAPYVERIDRNKWYTNFGPLLLEYENRLTLVTGVDAVGGQCVTLSSGTAALELGIAALGLPEGACVLLPAFTFPATALAVLRCGLKPVFCDVHRDSWTMTPDIAHAAVQSHNCKLIVPVAALGFPLPVAEWDEFSRSTGIPVLIDAAAALGHQQVGRASNVVFSLHATKPLGVGEGGIFATSDPDMAERVRRMTNFGYRRERIAIPCASNAKMSEYAAAVGLAQLDRWPELLERRRAKWATYRAAIRDMPGIGVQPWPDHIPPAVLSLKLPADAEGVVRTLANAGIETRRWYLPSLHHHPLFAGAARVGPQGAEALPVTEEIDRRNLGVPFHHFLSGDDIQTVLGALKGCL